MRYYPEVKKAIGASEKIFEYLDRKPQIPPPGSLAPENFKGHVQFKNVRFSYSGKTDENSLVLKVCAPLRCFLSFPKLFVLPKFSFVKGCDSGGNAGTDHCTCWTKQIREDDLCEATWEVLPASIWRNPAGWETTEKLQRPVPTWKGGWVVNREFYNQMEYLNFPVKFFIYFLAALQSAIMDSYMKRNMLIWSISNGFRELL